MITHQDIEELKGLVKGQMVFSKTDFGNEAAETLTELALKHYPMLRVLDSNHIALLEKKIALYSAELKQEISSLAGDAIQI